MNRFQKGDHVLVDAGWGLLLCVVEREGRCGERTGDGCGAPILWVRTPQQRYMPLDLADEDEDVGSQGNPFKTHFTTCPDAEHFRRARAGKPET